MLVGDANECCLQHGRMGQQGFVDLPRRDVSPLDDQLLDAAGDFQGSILVFSGGTTGINPRSSA